MRGREPRSRSRSRKPEQHTSELPAPAICLNVLLDLSRWMAYLDYAGLNHFGVDTSQAEFLAQW